MTTAPELHEYTDPRFPGPLRVLRDDEHREVLFLAEDVARHLGMTRRKLVSAVRDGTPWNVVRVPGVVLDEAKRPGRQWFLHDRGVWHALYLGVDVVTEDIPDYWRWIQTITAADGEPLPEASPEQILLYQHLRAGLDQIIAQATMLRALTGPDYVESPVPVPSARVDAVKHQLPG